MRRTDDIPLIEICDVEPTFEQVFMPQCGVLHADMWRMMMGAVAAAAEHPAEPARSAARAASDAAGSN